MKINPAMKALALDVLERTFFTFVEAFLGIMIISPLWNVSALHAAAMAGLAAAAAYVKSTLATLKAGTLSPSSVSSGASVAPLPAYGVITLYAAPPVAPAITPGQDGGL